MQANPINSEPVKPIQEPLIASQLNPYNQSLQSGYQAAIEDQPPAPLDIDMRKQDGPLDHLSDGLAGQARAAFIAKVYVLLTIELVFTFGICLVAQYVEAYRDFQLNYPWVISFPIVLVIVSMLVACCVPKARVFPLDTICLVVFLASFSYIMSMFCSLLVSDTEGPIIPMAVLATLGITTFLTVYAFLCKGNFSVMGILLVAIPGAIVLGVMSIFFYFPVLVYVFCSLGILIFGIYLVILTKMIIGGEVVQFPMDAPILASLFLYMYIMRIFLYILMILGAAKK